MKGLAQKELGEPYEPRVTELVRAQFTSDDTWYRAKVTGKTADGQYQVSYIDYGNVTLLLWLNVNSCFSASVFRWSSQSKTNKFHSDVANKI